MRLSLWIYQRRARGWLRWTTLGVLDPPVEAHGRTEHAVREACLSRIRKAMRELGPRELARFATGRAPELHRLRLDLTLRSEDGTERRSDLFPLVVWDRGEVTVALVPDAPASLFVVDDASPLDTQARRHLQQALAGQGADAAARCATLGDDRILRLAFSAELGDGASRWRPPTPGLERLGAEVDVGRSTLGIVGQNLTGRAVSGELAVGVPREPWRSRLLGALSGPRRRSVALIGPAGSGRSTLLRRLVADLAEADGYPIHRNLDRCAPVWQVSGSRILAGMSYVGQWEARVMKLLKEARGPRAILWFEDLATLGRTGRSREVDRSLADVLRGPVSRGEVTLLGTLTPTQADRLEAEAPELWALFTPMGVEPPSPTDALRMLVHEGRALARGRELTLSPEVFGLSIDLTSPFGSLRALPGRASELLRAASEGITGALEPEHLVQTLAERVGLPPGFLDDAAAVDVEGMRRRLSAQVAGQAPAVEAALDLLLRIRTQLTAEGRPWGVYLLAGPTGTGKTELAKALARTLYGGEGRLIRLDMGELSGADAPGRLVGDSAQPEGALTRAIRAEPYSVVLFDEIEKAHPSVFGLLLQLLDEGRLTDAAGERADFTRSVILMTSNLGARERPKAAFASAAEGDGASLAAIRAHFPPELFNRIDRVIPFSYLDEAAAEAITRLQLERLLGRPGLVERDVFVRVGPGVVKALTASGFSPEEGARRLRKAVEDAVAVPLAERLVTLQPAPATLLAIGAQEGAITLDVTPLSKARPARPAPLDPSGLHLTGHQLRASLERAHSLLKEAAGSPGLAALQRALSEHLERFGGTDADHGHRVWDLDRRRTAIQEALDELEAALAAPDEAEELERERFSSIPLQRPHALHPDRLRILDRRRQAVRPVGWRGAVRHLMSARRLHRAVTDGAEAGGASVLVTLRVLARAGEPIPLDRAPFIEATRLAYEALAEEVVARAFVDADGAPARPERSQVTGCALHLFGLGLEELLRLEVGCHCLKARGRGAELLEVRVRPAPEALTGEALFEAARAAPTAPLPLTRTLHTLGATEAHLDLKTAPLRIEDHARPVTFETEGMGLGWALEAMLILEALAGEEVA